MTPSWKRLFLESTEFGFLMQIKASEFTELIMKEMKKQNDSGHICRLTLSWKAPSTQNRIFLKQHLYIVFTWIALSSGLPSTHETSESSHRNIRMTLQQNGSVSWRRERARKGLNTTSGAQFAALPLVKPVWFARVVVNWLTVAHFTTNEWSPGPLVANQV